MIFIAQAHMWLKIPMGIELTTLLLFVVTITVEIIISIKWVKVKIK